MEEMIGSVSVPAIAAIVYWVVNLIKYATKNNEKLMSFIPVIACSIGVVCGIIAFFVVPELILAKNVVYAAVIGGASGLSAVGFNQILKQIEKKSGEAQK